MDKLLALFAGTDDQGDVAVTLRSATWSGTSLHLLLAVSILESDPDSPAVWEVRCEDALAYALRDEGALSLKLIDDHPLLWDFKHEAAQAFFYGAPSDADSAVGALYEAHQNAVGSWIRFGQHLNSAPGLSKLLSAGDGLLAEGPVPLLTLYKGSVAPAQSGRRCPFLASTEDMGWNPLAAIGTGQQREGAFARHFFRRRYWVDSSTEIVN